jgi:uncharacterized membrane protein
MDMSQNHVQAHIDLIAQHEQDFLARRTVTERLGDQVASFVGSLAFVVLHLLLFIGWIAFNTLAISQSRHFDPAPFSLLGTMVALEAILLASLILMRQARMSRRAEERDHLMLQILLLTEKEITAVLGVERKIGEQVGLEQVVNTKEMHDLSEQTSIDDVAQTIKESLPQA